MVGGDEADERSGIDRLERKGLKRRKGSFVGRVRASDLRQGQAWKGILFLCRYLDDHLSVRETRTEKKFRYKRRSSGQRGSGSTLCFSFFDRGHH